MIFCSVFSPIDNKPMEGIPSIRVHNGKDYVNGGRLIRWTEVFIVQVVNRRWGNDAIVAFFEERG